MHGHITGDAREEAQQHRCCLKCLLTSWTQLRRTDPDPPCCCDQGEERLAREHTRPLGEQLFTSLGMILRLQIETAEMY